MRLNKKGVQHPTGAEAGRSPKPGTIINYASLIACLAISILQVAGQDFQTNHLLVGESGGVAEFRIPALLATQKGTLLAVCDARVDRPGDVPNNVDQVIRRSHDNGITWEPVQTLVDFPNQEGAADPQLLQDSVTGRIFLFYDFCPGKNQDSSGSNLVARHLALHCIQSDDDGLTWSLPVMAEYGLKNSGWHSLMSSPGRGYQLRNGRLIVPAMVYDYHNLNSHLIYSDDHGDSWKISPVVGKDVDEPSFVQLDDQTLLINGRSHVGHRAMIRSTDGGASWSDVTYHPELKDPGCQGSLMKSNYKGQEILLSSNPAHSLERRNMTVKASFDQGKTWPVRKIIFGGPSAYSCITTLPDGDIGLLYENGDFRPYERISYTKFSLEWLIDQEEYLIVAFGSSTTATRKTINQVYAQRLPGLLQSAGISAKVINAGVPGSHTGSIKDNARHQRRHALDRLESDVLDYGPDLVIILLGLNDSWIDSEDPQGPSRIPLAKFRENLNYMINELSSIGSKVILMTPNSIGDKYPEWRLQRSASYAQAIREVSLERNVPIVDTWELFEQYDQQPGRNKDDLMLDGMHPNDQGQAMIAEKLSEIIPGILGR